MGDSEWFSGLERSIASLRNHPERCTVVTKFSTRLDPVRQLLHGNYPVHLQRSIFISLVGPLKSCHPSWCTEAIQEAVFHVARALLLVERKAR
jgi:hypothetical protein